MSRRRRGSGPRTPAGRERHDAGLLRGNATPGGCRMRHRPTLSRTRLGRPVRTPRGPTYPAKVEIDPSPNARAFCRLGPDRTGAMRPGDLAPRPVHVDRPLVAAGGPPL